MWGRKRGKKREEGFLRGKENGWTRLRSVIRERTEKEKMEARTGGMDMKRKSKEKGKKQRRRGTERERKQSCKKAERNFAIK
jgi:hypothetical protein